MKTRLFGIENEYTAFDNLGQKVASPPIQSFINSNPETAIALFTHFRNYGDFDGLFLEMWLANGGRIYTDGPAYEFASPECVELRELVLVDKAGDELIKKLFRSKLYLEHNNEIFLMKRTASYKMVIPHTWGAHENYLVPGDIFRKIVGPGAFTPEHLFLESHLVSRIIYTGAGHLEYVSPSHLSFWVSPRARFIFKRKDTSTKKDNRAIINTRNEPLFGTAAIGTQNLEYVGPKRLHLICGDMHRSDWSLYLKIGTTLLVLEYLEIASERTLRKLVRNLYFDDPVIEMQKSAKPFDDSLGIKSFWRMMDVQRHIIDALYTEKEELENRVSEAESILELWDRVLADVTKSFLGEDTESSRRLDWLIKKRLFEEATGDSLFALGRIRDKKLHKRLLGWDMNYHRLNAHDLYRKLVESGRISELYSHERALYYLTHPPRGRAWRRVQLAKYLEKLMLLPYVARFQWNAVVFRKDIDREIVFDERGLDVLKSEVDAICQLIKEKGLT